MSFPYLTNHNSPSNGAKNPNVTQHQSNIPGSPAMQRRESLVKPTWHNVCPGEVPADTLEKLNKLTNGERHQLHQLNSNQHDGAPLNDDTANANGANGGSGGANNNNPAIGGQSIGAHQRRQVELYDIFGKVNKSIL